MASKFIMLFALMLSGYILGKIGFLNKTVTLGLNKMVIFFAFPCLIAYKIGTTQPNGSLMRDFLLMNILSIASFILFTLFAKMYYKVRGISDRISSPAFLCTVMPNNGFIGYPVALMFLGEPGLLMMLAHAAIALNLYAYTYAINYIRKDKEKNQISAGERIKTLARQTLLNPNIIAIAVGLIIMAMRIPLDNVVGDFLSAITDMASPLAMIYVGAILAGDKVSEAFREKSIWEISFVKLIVLPVITAVCVMWLPLSPLVKASLILGASFPCATYPIMFAQQEGVDYSQAVRAMLLSTILSMISLPVVMTLLKTVLPV